MNDRQLTVITTNENSEIIPIMERALLSVREELRDDPYILEAVKVLQVGGYRSSIGSFWNAVVDDLRNKILFRSISLFNKSIDLTREIKTYEDFQNYVNDDHLIEGAYKIGVIGWEASKVLKHAKETRHIFSGHPKSSDPSIIKVLAMMDDCIKYVLNAEYPAQIIDVKQYVANLAEQSFDRNVVSIESALGDLPEIYKNELANRLYTSYLHPQSTSILRSNIEFVAPILWRVLPKTIKVQIARRVDQEIQKGNSEITQTAFSFIELVQNQGYLSVVSRRYQTEPLVHALTKAFDDFPRENEAVKALVPYASLIPEELMAEYVLSLTKTYVGRMGSSARYSRTDFYADGAALYIPEMFKSFDDHAANHFIDGIKNSELLIRRIKEPAKLRRLRVLANIVFEKISESFHNKQFIESLCDETRDEEFFQLIRN
ncbi:hypothetical protein LNTAR_06269 [Lentisphaera araneosa HTCC2155]|uniref:Uncharacterized protein n=1 Tax=Lentisphaera araneosa HTCC2155 TaxID=313628 RepID=A6DN80_9BACT|nr:hypothetical protein [Lentisphaera araneosa]EDM26828.1 hypothetical protein LNTAR_06269 [Lentisphaera araneosa HTCC2155]